LYENRYENIYVLHGELTVVDKNRIISEVGEKLNNSEKILLLSTQSIEAGVDLDFDCGIREYAPFSAIIQMAGRVNRHNKKKQGEVYILGTVSEYTEAIYSDSILVNNEIDIPKQIEEREQLSFTEKYFSCMHENNTSAGFNKLYEKLEFL